MVAGPVPTVNAVPRRSTPDPLAKRIGARLRELRKAAGLSLRALVDQIDLGDERLASRGYISDIEAGLSLPTLATLHAVAECLGVELLDLVTFPAESERQRLVHHTRGLTKGTVRRLLRETDTKK